MRNTKLLISVFLLLFVSATAYSQSSAVELPGTHVLKFKSVINNQDYVLNIQLPGSYGSDTTRKYPVLYMLDGQWSFPVLRGIQGGLYYDGFVPEMILVGITWPDNYDANRNRDFSPTHIKEDSTSGGGSKFLNVIKEEVLRLVDSTYRTDPNNNMLTGGSYGGLFALYVVFHEPALFKHYIIGSPSLDYDDAVTFKFEKEYAARHRQLNARLFITSSEYEEEVDQTDYFNKLIKQIKAHNYKGLEMESLVVPKMSHASSGPYAWARGLQFIFRKPEVKTDTSLLDQFTGRYKLFNDTITITRTGNALYLNFMRGKVLMAKPRLYAETGERFYTKGIQGTLQFKKDNKGKVTGFDLVQNNNSMYLNKID
ncbi:MAG: alpha/beta hydrolase-fold protein [Ferruginibacter sp.]